MHSTCEQFTATTRIVSACIEPRLPLAGVSLVGLTIMDLDNMLQVCGEKTKRFEDTRPALLPTRPSGDAYISESGIIRDSFMVRQCCLCFFSSRHLLLTHTFRASICR